jgi:two-component system sensor histidine kinase MtrB
MATAPAARKADRVAFHAGKRTGRRPRRRALGLRARLTIGFALAALVVSLSLTLATYVLARNYLLDQRESGAITQALVNARLMRDILRSPQALPNQVVRDLRTESDGHALLNFRGSWFPSNVLRFNQDALPASLREATLAGQSGRQRFDVDGTPYIGVGVYAAELDAAYLEVFSMASLQRTLSVILTSLLVGSAIATVGAAAFGAYTSRRLLRPLSRVAGAASELASGDFDTRLEPEPDPDLDRLVSSFNDMADAVQSRIEREARFASDVSHELRSPITALSAAVEVLDGRRNELPERSQKALEVVVSQVQRFDQMVLDLLEISRVDAGRIEMHLEPTLLGDFLARVAARYGYSYVPVEVTKRWRDRPVPIDKRRLERAVANLLDNAAQHAAGPVRIGVEGGAEWVRILVEDAGPGVPGAEKERIFERFARGSAARHRVGTGLGLALVAEHARLHGGRAWVEDRPGGGSRFIIELPAGRG